MFSIRGIYSSPLGPDPSNRGKGENRPSSRPSYLKGVSPIRIKNLAKQYRGEFLSKSKLEVSETILASEGLTDQDAKVIQKSLAKLDDESVVILHKQFERFDEVGMAGRFSKGTVLKALHTSPKHVAKVLSVADTLSVPTLFGAIVAEKEDQRLVQTAITLMEKAGNQEDISQEHKVLLQRSKSNRALEPLFQKANRAATQQDNLRVFSSKDPTLKSMIEEQPNLAGRAMETVSHVMDRMEGDLNEKDSIALFKTLMATGEDLIEGLDHFLLQLESLAGESGEYEQVFITLSNAHQGALYGGSGELTMKIAMAAGEGVELPPEASALITGVSSDLLTRHTITNTQFLQEDAMVRVLIGEFGESQESTANRAIPAEKHAFESSGLSWALVPTTLEDHHLAFRISRPNGSSIESKVELPSWVTSKEHLLTLYKGRDQSSDLEEVVKLTQVTDLPGPDELRKMIDAWQYEAEMTVQKAIQEVQHPSLPKQGPSSEKEILDQVQDGRIYERDDGLALTPAYSTVKNDPTRLPEGFMDAVKKEATGEGLRVELFAKQKGDTLALTPTTTLFEDYHEQTSNFIKVTTRADDGTERIDYLPYYDTSFEEALQGLPESQFLEQHYLRMQSRLLTRRV